MRRYPLTACALHSAAAIVSCLIRSTTFSATVRRCLAHERFISLEGAIFVASLKGSDMELPEKYQTRLTAFSIHNSADYFVYVQRRSFSDYDGIASLSQRKFKMYYSV